MDNNNCELSDCFKIRFMRPEESGRLAELIDALQKHQKLNGVKRIPSERELAEELTHNVTCYNDGKIIEVKGNNYGTFVGLAIDTSKLNDCKNKSYIVGYIIYTQSYSIINGRQLYLTSLFIQEEYRFLGLGKLLIRFMQHHGEQLGNHHFDVPFMLNNSIGIKFYNKMGAYLVGDKYHLACFKEDNQAEKTKGLNAE